MSAAFFFILFFYLKVQISCSLLERSFVRDCFRSFAFSFTDLLEISLYIHENFSKYFYKNMFCGMPNKKGYLIFFASVFSANCLSHGPQMHSLVGEN